MTLYAFRGLSPALPEDGDCWIAPGTHIIGQVELQKAVSIWFGSTLRGDNEPIVVGAGSNIQENCVFHTDPGFPLSVGRNCTIGHKALLHGCSIGDNTLVGMGSVILNGARVGRNSLVGASTLITERKEFPDGTLILGNPGRVVRDLGAAEIADLPRTARSYQRRFRLMKSDLRALTTAAQGQLFPEAGRPSDAT